MVPAILICAHFHSYVSPYYIFIYKYILYSYSHPTSFMLSFSPHSSPLKRSFSTLTHTLQTLRPVLHIVIDDSVH